MSNKQDDMIASLEQQNESFGRTILDLTHNASNLLKTIKKLQEENDALRRENRTFRTKIIELQKQ